MKNRVKRNALLSRVLNGLKWNPFWSHVMNGVKQNALQSHVMDGVKQNTLLSHVMNGVNWNHFIYFAYTYPYQSVSIRILTSIPFSKNISEKNVIHLSEKHA